MLPDVISQISLATFINAAKNHWFAACVVFCLTMVLAVLAMIFLPKTYHSDAMIFVKLGRETVSLDPTASTGNRVSVLESRESEINSIRDMLHSRSIVEKVVDRISPAVILGDDPLTDENFEDNFVTGTDFLNSPRQKAIKLISQKTAIITARKSNVLTIAADAASPQLAQRILKEHLDVYQTMHNDAHQTPKSNTFFEKQSKLLQIKWQESMKALQIAKEDAGVVSIEGAKENLKEQTNEAQTTLMSRTSLFASTQARLRRFEAIRSRNPLDQQSIRDDYIAAKSELSAVRAEKTAAESALQSMLARAAKLNRDEVTISALEQEVNLAASNFQQYQELLEQTRIEEALHQSKFTNVRIVQEPSFIPKPVSPKKSILALAGIVAGTSGGALFALFLEIFFTKTRPKEGEGQLVPEPDYPDNDEFSCPDVVQRAREVVDTING